MRVIFLGDIHGFSRFLPMRYWLGPCLAGWLNMRWNPNRKFNFDLWPITLEYIRSLEPDWVLCSGDLTQLSLEEEFQKVLGPWRQILPGPRTRIVPGNHDRYTRAAARGKIFEKQVGPWAPTDYPHLEKLTEGWYLLALDSTSPQRFNATGAIGSRQLQALQDQLGRFGDHDNLLLLTHYPMLLADQRHNKPGHLLRDAAALRRVLATSRARLIYLHGHVHEPWSWRCPERDLPRLHCLNAGCPTRCSPTFPHGQGFWELLLPQPESQGNDFQRPARDLVGGASDSAAEALPEAGVGDRGQLVLRRHHRSAEGWVIRQEILDGADFPG